MTEETQKKPFVSPAGRDAAAKATESRIPEKLLDIDQIAGKAWSGFWALGGYTAAKKFSNSITNKLNEAGWPVFGRDDIGVWQRDKGTKAGVTALESVNSFVDGLTDPGGRVTLGGKELNSRKDRRNAIPSHMSFDDDFAEGLAFVIKPENVATLEKAVNDAVAELKPQYGDPLAVKYGQRSLLRAVFNAAMEKKPLGYLNRLRSAEANDAAYKEFRLIKVLQNTLLPLMKHFRDTDSDKPRKWVPAQEFMGRLEEYLTAWYGWKLAPDSENNKVLSDTLWQLARAAEAKTTLFVRLALQDETKPVRPAVREAKDFILNHVDEIETAAIKGVVVELNKELASPEGLRARHVNFVGQEKTTTPRQMQPKP